jgi:hypothetical protein
MSLLQSACKKTETMTRMSTDGLHAEEVLIQDLKTLLGDKFDLTDYTERTLR